MTVKKVISHYNQIKSIHRLTTSDEIINSRMFVILINGVDSMIPDMLQQTFSSEKKLTENQTFFSILREILLKSSSEKNLAYELFSYL